MLDRFDYEKHRIAATKRLNILGTAPERRFDRITLLAQRYFGVETAVFSIIDQNRHWNKSISGSAPGEIPRAHSFCDHTITQDGALVVPDLLADSRFARNPLVERPQGIRFYAGVPIREPSGFKIGALCIIDSKPLLSGDIELDVLSFLAKTIEQELAASYFQNTCETSGLITKDELFDTVFRAQNIFLGNRDENAVFRPLLEDILSLTGSEMGFIGETMTSENGEVSMRNGTASDAAKKWLESLQFAELEKAGSLLTVANKLIEPTRLNQDVFIIRASESDPLIDPQLLPSYIATINEFMGIPILAEGRQVGFIGLANRPGGFTSQIAVELAPLLKAIGTMIERKELYREQRRVERKLKNAEDYDELTGLPNRRMLERLLSDARSKAADSGDSLSVCFIDLDGFKSVNDALGHDHGDQILRDIARRLQGAVRADDIVARLGGDEFVAVLKNAASEKAYARLLTAVLTTIDAGEEELSISGSIGVTVFPDDCSNGDQLIRHADHAMYAAKEEGKGRISMFDLGTHIEKRRNNELRREVEEGLKLGHLMLYYQPKLSLHRRRVVGFEALIRWDHPECGLVSPVEFLPGIACSETDLAVGRFVIQEALATLLVFETKGLDYTLSINLSPHHFMGESFASEFAALLGPYSTNIVEKLTIEVLENTLLDGNVAVLENLKRVKELGVKVSLDDFGTGFSSLDYFRKLPAHEVKIDRSFIQDMLTNPDNAMIVEATIALSHSFKRQVVAEGIETREVEKRLRELGCDLVQGFLYGRPEPLPKALAGAARLNGRAERRLQAEGC